jgi:D-alanine-D-alanine ligase
LRVGIAFDLVPSGPSRLATDGPDDQFEEFDKPETVDAIAKVLCSRGHEVPLLGDGPGLIRQILDDPPDLVWNMAEGQGVGRCREARVPAVLEMLGIPYTGSDPLTLAATLDKDVAKRIVASDGTVLVPRSLSFRPGVAKGEFWDSLDLRWAGTESRLLLKPSFEGSSKGIRARCLCKTWEDAWKTYSDLSGDYGQTILVEEFIEGDEITVGLLGEGEILGVMRVAPKRPSPEFIYSLEVKRDWRRLVDYEAPARFEPDEEEHLLRAARDSYRLLGCRDVARIDFRLRNGKPYFIEANPLPGLAPVTSDLVILAEGYGLSHADLIGRIFEAALTRLGMPER